MNKSQLAKSLDCIVRLQPTAVGSFGEALDDDWLIVEVGEDAIALEHSHTRRIAHVGFDAVFSYVTDAHGRRTPNERRGFLQLFVQIAFTADGGISVTPIPPPRLAPAGVSPLDAESARLARDQYRSFWPAARGAIRALLVAGEMTDQQMFHYLNGRSEPSDGGNLLGRIASGSNLLQRVQPDDTPQVKLLGYTGAYRLNPRLKLALERLVADDDELPRR